MEIATVLEELKKANIKFDTDIQTSNFDGSELEVHHIELPDDYVMIYDENGVVAWETEAGYDFITNFDDLLSRIEKIKK